MQNKKYCLFDLDGTLTDPASGITRSVRYALQHFGIEVKELSELHRFIGPPLRDSFMEFYGFDEKQTELAVQKYREYYPEKGIFDNRVYEGIPALLKALKEAGKHVILATSKPEIFAKQILCHFGIDSYFDVACGSSLDGTREKKAEVIEYALDQSGIVNRSEAVMIGDRNFDILGAKQTGISSIGVLYGYGTEAELEEAGADAIARDVDVLGRILLN